MDARERWHALQARLIAARAAVDAGDRATALAEITAALELDGAFLAAHALRDRILTTGDAVSDAASAADATASNPAPSNPGTSHLAPSHPAPQDAPSGYAKFEQRARRRRVDRRVDAARAAMEQQRLKTAAMALDEVIELDPTLPELAELTARFDELRRAAATPRRGPWIAAAAVFIAAVFGGSWIENSSPILSRQIVSAAPAPDRLTPSVTVAESFDTFVVAPNRAPLSAGAVATTGAGAASAVVSDAGADEAAGVSLALLGYRWTPDAADASSGFDRCDPQVQGDAATAVCHAGDVVWNVSLRKAGTAWTVESARAER